MTEMSHDGLLKRLQSRAFGNTIICPCEYLVDITRFQAISTWLPVRGKALLQHFDNRKFFMQYEPRKRVWHDEMLKGRPPNGRPFKIAAFYLNQANRVSDPGAASTAIPPHQLPVSTRKPWIRRCNPTTYAGVWVAQLADKV